MSDCQHGAGADCIECEIGYRREYLAELEGLVLACKRQISELAQRQVKKIPVIGKVQPTGNVIFWPGLGGK